MGGPRGSLALLCASVGAALTWAALVLPWRGADSPFGAATLVLAAVHGTTALFAAAGSRHRVRAWQMQSALVLVYLGWLGFAVWSSAAQLAALYGGLGRGVALVLFGGGVVVAALLLPCVAWCVATTASQRSRRRAAGAGLVAIAVLALGIRAEVAAARADPLVELDASTLHAALAEALPDATPLDGSLMTRAPAVCATVPGDRVATLLVAHRGDDGPVLDCIQAATLAEAIELARQRLHDTRGRIAIDVVTARRELVAENELVDLFAVRPGRDGVCDGTRCFAPWQLVAMQAFAAAAPLELLHELRFGFDPHTVRAEDGVEGLVRIETASFATDAAGELQPLERLRRPGPPLDAASLRAALVAAEDYLAAAQLPDGRFAYLLDPYAGTRSMTSFSIARQAGTTLALCELAGDRVRAKAMAERALQVLVDATSHAGALAMLHDPGDPPPDVHDLGDSALGAIALLACRPLVGDRFDAHIAALGRFLLAMQRDDGSFHPQYDLARRDVVVGPEPLFAVGQAILALVLLEPLAAELPERFVAPERVRAAVESAMQHVATDDWGGFGADFFYLEENWHCLAARAALPHHRHDGYERFCLDYVRWKTRLVLDETSGVAPDLVGGYGFGNVVLPWTAGAATFGEAAAAALVLADARAEPKAPIESRLRLALGFLVHHQWKAAECFACSAAHSVVGAWSEHPGAPMIRIDQVQHAMAALGHGGRVLGLR